MHMAAWANMGKIPNEKALRVRKTINGYIWDNVLLRVCMLASESHIRMFLYFPLILERNINKNLDANRFYF